MEIYVLFALGSCVIVNISFDLWMFGTRFDTFSLVVNIIDKGWVLKHVTIHHKFNMQQINNENRAKFVHS
jgi:hypothetical protein